MQRRETELSKDTEELEIDHMHAFEGKTENVIPGRARQGAIGSCCIVLCRSAISGLLSHLSRECHVK